MTTDVLTQLYAEREALDTRIREEENAVIERIRQHRTRDAMNELGTAIAHTVAKETGIDNFLDETKEAPYVEARALAYHIATRAGWSSTRIARWAGRNHTTILHALNAHADLADEANQLYKRILGERDTDAA